MLASDLRLSRNTVLQVFARLSDEGFLITKRGSGTRVAPNVCHDEKRQAKKVQSNVVSQPSLSERGRVVAKCRVSSGVLERSYVPFRPGLPALDEFPFDAWARVRNRVCRQLGHSLLGYAQPFGYPPLRREVAGYLRSVRGVRCDWRQVIVTSGAQQAFDLVARLLLDPGQVTAVEDPCHVAIRGCFVAAGATVAPIPTDAEGIDIKRLEQAQDVRIVVTTPSHQFPLGTTMTLPRRIALIDWARRHKAWLVEDDYDAEFSFNGRPMPSLYGLDGQCVLYVGTFSKSLYPGLRLGYVIVPERLVDAFAAARAVIDRHGLILDQAMTAAFIESGQFARHVRRMRAVYEEKAQIVQSQVKNLMDDRLFVPPIRGGMHTIGWLRDGSVSDASVADVLLAHGIDAAPISRFSALKTTRSGLVLGFSGYSIPELVLATEKMRKVLRKSIRPRSKQ